MFTFSTQREPSNFTRDTRMTWSQESGGTMEGMKNIRETAFRGDCYGRHQSRTGRNATSWR